MDGFLESLGNTKVNPQVTDGPNFRIISNSTDILSSERNVELGAKFPGQIIPFVGIHPQSVEQMALSAVREGGLGRYFERLNYLVSIANGIGEIGLDPKYGYDDLQLKIFQKQLEICESARFVPISIHSRNSVERVSELLPSFGLSKRVLFHWFAGTESELTKIQSRGYFVSFGPSVIFSKRIQGLAKSADSKLVLAETDSPLLFPPISEKDPLSPFAVSSVIFKLGEVRSLTYEKMLFEIEQNSNEYLQAQNSLRVRKE
jgi:TatD DNase family protein